MANNIIGTVGIGAQSVKPDWNQNDPNAKDYIKNRPGGYAVAPSVEITWDGDTTGKETIVVPNNGTLVKIADEAPSIEKFTVGTDYRAIIMAETTYSDGSNETVQKQIDLSNGGDFWMGQSSSPFCMAMGVTVDSVNIGGLTLTKGLWFSIADGAEMAKVIACGISTTDGGVKKFPVSLMPDEVYSGINDAQDMAETAQNTADTAQSTANTAKSTAESAQNTANTAKSTAESAQSTANTAKSTAESAQSTANSALPKSGGDITGSINFTGTGSSSGNGDLIHIGTYVDTGTNLCQEFGPHSSNVEIPPLLQRLASICTNLGYSQLYWSFVSPVGNSYDGRLCYLLAPGGRIRFGSTANGANSYKPIDIEARAIILRSSDSGKRFKITVDDTGTISATEVTT